MDLNELMLDESLEAKGAPFEYGTLTLYVRSSDYGPFRDAWQKGISAGGRIGSPKQIAHAGKFQKNKLPGLVAQHLITGWDGLTNDGKEIPFSREAALKYVPHWHIIAEIKEFADDKANYVALAKEDAGKKLKAVSSS